MCKNSSIYNMRAEVGQGQRMGNLVLVHTTLFSDMSVQTYSAASMDGLILRWRKGLEFERTLDGLSAWHSISEM